MIIICGKTIEEVERDLAMAKAAIASGMPYGVGGATIEDAERGLEMMQAMMGGAVAPISNPNYDPCNGCPHWKPNNECEVSYECDDCGYGYEDEEEDETVPPVIAALEEMLRYLGADEDTIHKMLS